MSGYLSKALEIAVIAHNGQIDKAGKPYIGHPVYIALQMETEEEKAVALLHDVIEDTEYTEADLINAGIPENVVDAVKAITHPEGQDYYEYLQEVKKNPLALKVKIQDVMHNSDISRIERPTEKDYARLEKYKKAMKILNE